MLTPDRDALSLDLDAPDIATASSDIRFGLALRCLTLMAINRGHSMKMMPQILFPPDVVPQNGFDSVSCPPASVFHVGGPRV